MAASASQAAHEMTTDNTRDEFDEVFKQAASQLNSKETPVENAAPNQTTTEAPAPTETAAAAPAPAESTPAEQPADKPAGPTLESLAKDLEAAQHRERSSANRISAFARQNEALQRQLAELQEKVNKGAAAPAAAAPAPAPADDVLSKAPDLEAAVAKRVKDALDPVLKTVEEATQRAGKAEEAATRVTEVVEPIRQRAEKSTFEETWTALDKDFTGQWRADIKSQAFADFIGSASKEIQSLHKRAVTPAECSDVLDLFYAKRGGRPQPKTTPADETAAPAATDATPNQARLRQAAGVPSRGNSRPPAPAANDFDGAFSQAFARLRATQS